MRLLIAMTVVLTAWSAQAANWPQWRGPDGTGVAGESDFPLKWSATDHIVWKKALPGPGNSSPIVWNDRVFVTQSIDKGAKRAVLCFDRKDGSLLWQKEIEFAGTEPTHGDNPYCSATPATDDQQDSDEAEHADKGADRQSGHRRRDGRGQLEGQYR